jgi:hypothetical protein
MRVASVLLGGQIGDVREESGVKKNPGSDLLFIFLVSRGKLGSGLFFLFLVSRARAYHWLVKPGNRQSTSADGQQQKPKPPPQKKKN